MQIHQVLLAIKRLLSRVNSLSLSHAKTQRRLYLTLRLCALCVRF
jgi:hypothetical protein